MIEKWYEVKAEGVVDCMVDPSELKKSESWLIAHDFNGRLIFENYSRALLCWYERKESGCLPKAENKCNLVLRLKAGTKQEELVSYAMNWNKRLAEEFVNKGNGVWESAEVYQSQQEQDKAAIRELQKFTSRCMRKYSISDYQINVIEC